MPLDRRDLDAIREIVREEIQRALGPRQEASSASAPRADDDEADDDEVAVARREMVAADLARLRGESGAGERALQAEARYRLVTSDSGWLEKARRHRSVSIPAGAPVTQAEMVAALRAAEEKSRRRKARRNPP